MGRALQAAGQFLIFCAVEAILWGWAMVGNVPIFVLIAGHLVAAGSLVPITAVIARHALSELRDLKLDWIRFWNL